MAIFANPVVFLRGFNGTSLDVFCIFYNYCESLHRVFYTFLKTVEKGVQNTFFRWVINAIFRAKSVKKWSF